MPLNQDQGSNNCSVRRLRSVKPPRRLLIRQKQNNFVLDCTNQLESRLKPYCSINDKYLNYFVVRVRKGTHSKSRMKNLHPREASSMTVKKQELNDFISLKRKELLRQIEANQLDNSKP